MGKPLVKSKQAKSNPSNNIQKERKIKKKKKQQQQQQTSNPLEDNDTILFESDHGADEEDDKTSPEDLQRLLERYSKDQLITFLTDAASDDPHLLSQIRSLADDDIAHRKIFVRGIGWDVTTESLLDAFRPYGPVLDCHIVVDKASGRNKGYGFVIFSNRSGAVKALKVPEKKIGTRMAFCQFASIGNVAHSSNPTDLAQRRVYVNNVPADVSPEKLKDFFATFGEIESGPSGFDMITGKSRGFAIFVYKTQDGANRALKEPNKMFEGNQLNCKLAFDHSQKGKLPAAPVAPQSLPVINQQPTVNLAAAAPQNVAMLGHNPAYSMLLFQNPLYANAALNPNSVAALNPSALAAFNANLVASQGQGYGGVGSGVQFYGGQGGHGNTNVFGTYKPQESAGLSYGGSQFGQSSSLAPATGYFRTYP